MRTLPLIVAAALVVAPSASALGATRGIPALSSSSISRSVSSSTSRSATVTCTKTTAGRCSTFVCSDNTTYDTCDKATASTRSKASSSVGIRKKALTKALTKRIQSANKASSSAGGGTAYSCTEETQEGGCYFVYCGKEKKTDLLRVACPELAYGASFFGGATCSYTATEYASKNGTHKNGLCSVTCDKDEFPGLPIGYKKNLAYTSDCPAWMHVPEAPSKPGANDQYCKDHPEDTFVCNTSAG